MEATERNLRKERVGKVVSNKMDKSCVITVERKVKHPMYGKFMTKTTKLMVHDETNQVGIGDTIRVMETRPLSKNKRWRLIEILERAK
ncbi:30S ribosomal protein S17 [Dyadobacter sp. NIV53]|jgi:small subunit ribosomal protein S17|uniref:30S ribosomal protein S17 n=1 Tax=Dyadobacter sp. NIV53 TaxID=2861765 RepID=UPI001C878981|nr:30S ribosomal protein S17 [Dyadobacter sp. NIV53]